MSGVTSTSQITEGQRWKSGGLVAVLAGLCVGCSLMALIHPLGLRFLPVAGGLLFVPWLCSNPFRLFLWLIITYQVLWPARFELPAGLPDLAYERVLGAVLVGLIILRAVFRRQPIPKFGVVAGLIVISQVVVLLRTLLLSHVVKPEFGDFINFLVIPVMLYWSARSLIDSQHSLKWLIGALIAISVVIGLTGIYERVLDLEESAFAVSDQTGAGDTRFGGVPGGRAAGLLGNPAIYGAVMGLGLLCTLASLAAVRRPSLRILLLFLAVFLMYSVYVSFTRSAWISVMFALFVVQFFIPFLWKKTLPMFVVAGVLLAGVWMWSLNNSVMQDRVLEKGNVVGRMERALWCLDRFIEKPVLGWGFGATNDLMQREFDVGGFSTSHNTFLSMLMDGGIVPLVCFLVLLLYWLAKSWRVARTSERGVFERAAATAMAGFIVIYLLTGMSVELRYFGFFNSLCWIAGGLVERLADGLPPDDLTRLGEAR